jgi:hypothetical protein
MERPLVTAGRMFANHPVLCPNTTVTVFAVLFPPSGKYYPDSTYLWTWYAPQDASGLTSRPVTFMQSQSQINKGTSLALADYFYWNIFDQPISPANFTIPDACKTTDAASEGAAEGRAFFTTIPR